MKRLLFVMIGICLLAGIAIARNTIEQAVTAQVNFSREAAMAKANSSEKDFFTAIENGDEETVTKMLEEDSYNLLSATSKKGYTPLMAACAYAADPAYAGDIPDKRFLRIVNYMWPNGRYSESFVNASPRVNHQNKKGITALMLAAASNDVELVRYVLETHYIDGCRCIRHGKPVYAVKVNLTDSKHRTALFYALSVRESYRNKSEAEQIKLVHAQHEIVKALLARGAKVNIQDSKGVTPIMLAQKYKEQFSNLPELTDLVNDLEEALQREKGKTP